MVETYGLDRLEDELATEPLGADFEEAQFRQMFACDVEGDWRAQVTDQLVANGVAAADAPCVSDELWATMTADDVDVLLSGEITDAFAGRFYDALDACGALNPDQNRGQGE